MKWNMSKDAQVEVEAHVWYSFVKKMVKVFLTPSDKLDELKVELNRYFVHIGENQRTSHVIVQVKCVNMAADKVKDN